MPHVQSNLVYVTISEINLMLADEMCESAFSYVTPAGKQVILLNNVEYHIADTRIMRFVDNKPTHFAHV